MKVAIVNYGMGNLASVSRAIETIGHEPIVAQHPEELRRASHIILPGVGAFAEGMDRLSQSGWISELQRQVQESGRPLLGICLGMQFLADRGHEGGKRTGLGFVPGEIVHLAELGCKERVPHVGWNELAIRRPDPLFTTIADHTDYYFVHSYAFRPEAPEDSLGTVPYGCDIPAVVRRGNVWGTQFHPEKSSKAGLQLLRNFVERS
jgi:imidazole glycerol-phosphate synthase subunit HisH